jgi:two-component system LytT family sensor kinase
MLFLRKNQFVVKAEVLICSLMNKKIYWLCQLAGWGSMVAIDTINWVYFIYGTFNKVRFWTIIGYALFGILVTHLFRGLLKKFRFFQKKTWSIWVVAILASILISALMAVLGIVVSMLQQSSNNKIEDGSFKIIFTLLGSTMNFVRYVGVWVIIYFMYKILQQNNTIQQEKLKLENLAKTTELELLKTQLNPHFLFNALNSIKALVIINPEQSRDAIVKLSELLRFTLQYGKEQLIPIKDEMDEVKKYLALEQLRFDERLAVTYNISESTFSQTLPPAIILTLAENAVKHGVAKQMGKGFIHIATNITNNCLQVEVTNNGFYQPSAAVGIGLKHIQKRLEEIYYQQADFRIEQKNGQVVVTIKTPLS